MIALKKKEILAELKKFGIDTASERKLYVREYKNYYTLHFEKSSCISSTRR